MPIANRAGGIVVGKFGTASVTYEELFPEAGMKVVVTGAAGMIGSNLVHGLNAIGIDDVIAVDDLTDGPKYRNLLGARISDYFDRSEFYGRFARGEFGRVDAVLHEGACSDTMEHDGRCMLDTNYRCSKDLLDACQAQGTRLLYASSAATYGGSAVVPRRARVRAAAQRLRLLEAAVRQRRAPHAAGGEDAGRGLSLLQRLRPARAAQGPHGLGRVPPLQPVPRRPAGSSCSANTAATRPGEQTRDFVSVDDVVAVNLWFLQHPEASGIFNLGTGRAQPFNDVARRRRQRLRAR